MRGAKYGQRPRQSAVRLISIPVAFGMAILLTMAMLVFANLSGRPFNPFSSIGGTSPGHNMLAVTMPAHSTSTQQANLTATAVVTPGGTAVVKEPHIRICSTKDNIAHLQLVICGFRFDSMHKVMLLFFVPGKAAFWLHNIPVDKHGQFHTEWSIVDCGHMPIYIFGYEATSSTPIKVKLHIASFGSCVAPTTPVVKPWGLSPRFGI
jgi:hypothetical protein